MLDLNLSPAEYRAYEAALRDPHSTRVDVAILTLSGIELNRITPVVLDGQVDVDADADVTRSLTMTLLDPHHALHLDSDSPDDGALYADRMIQAVYSTLVPELSERVDAEVFTGPLVAFERSGDVVTLTGHGKDELGLGANWNPLPIKKGARKTEAIRMILSERMGETMLDIPDLTPRLPRPLSLGRMAQPWPSAKGVAHSMNRQLFYDGAGVCHMRPRPKRPVFTFRSGDPIRSNITSAVKISHDFSTIKNAVHFKGGRPKGQKTAVEAYVAAPKGHPLSPIRLGRDNADGDRIGRYLVEERTNDAVRSHAEAERRAQALLDDILVEVLGVEFTSVPVPHLDPLDVIRVETDNFTANIRVRQFSLPLAGGDMTVGYIDRVSRPANRDIRGGRR